MNVPSISVVMAVYNGAEFLPQAVESILAQTHRDLEFIVVDDGSVDGTWEILNRYAASDGRLVLLRSPINEGVVRALNQGLDRSRGMVIARQDADDISHPQRLERQLEFLKSHPDHGLVAAVPQAISREGAPMDRPGWDGADNEEIQNKLLDYMCLCGPTITVRRECLQAAGFYFSEGLDASEDYDLCLRLAEVTKLASLGGPLYFYRQHGDSASSSRAHQQMYNKAVALERALGRRYGKSAPAEHIRTVARDYVHAALIGFVREDLAFARMALQRALDAYPRILHAAEPLEGLVRAYTPRDSVDRALEYTTSLFDDLLPPYRRMRRMRSRLLSDLHMAEVFEGARRGDVERARGHLGPGIRYRPGWLLNRGVVAALVRGGLPSRVRRRPRGNSG
jgi:glycosyltransferase involved in cell wall biosynthesis